jgi:hypothetical protein
MHSKQASKQQEKADETKHTHTHTHTHTEERAGEKATTRVHSTHSRRRRMRQAGRQAGEMEGADSDSTVAAGRVTELCRRKASEGEREQAGEIISAHTHSSAGMESSEVLLE